MVIDFHTHTFPERIAAAAMEKLQDAGHIPAHTDGTRPGLVKSMEEAGIKASVVLPVATNPQKVQSMNDLSLLMSGQYGLIYFGCVHPLMENAAQEIRRIARAGLKGIKIHPVYQGVDIDDPRFLRILEAAGEENMTVVMHAGDDIGFPGVRHCAPRMIRRALAQAGPVQLVAAHMGGWRNWEEAAQELADTQALIDTSFSLGHITPRAGENHYADEELRLLDETQFVRMVRIFGSERVLFGTDSPWASQKDALKTFSRLPLSETEKQNILCNNARRLLKI